MFLQWQDTITFHASLFRCFLLDTHSELAVFSQSLKTILAVIGQRLAQQALLSPLGRPNDATTRCPPRRRHEALSLTSFAMMPTDPPAVLHGLVTQPIHYDPYSHFGSDLPGPAWVPLGYDVWFMGMAAWFLLWLLTLAIAMWRSTSTERVQSASNRIIPRPFTLAVDAVTNAGKQARPWPQDQNEIRHSIMGVPEDVDIRVSMPGAWRHECRMQNTLEISTDMMSWWFVLNYTQCLSGSFAPSGPLVRRPKNEMTVVQTFENGDSLMCQELDAADTATPALDYTDSGSSEVNPHDSATRCESPTIGDVAIKNLDAPREDGIGPTFTQVASDDAIRFLCRDLDGDDSASQDRTDGTEDQDLISIDTQRPGISTLNRKDDCRALGRRQDGALSDTGYPLSHRRSYSVGRKHDIFDDGDDDSYWTEQVNARLSSPPPWRYEYDWSDVSLCPREGREDESDNWRVRHAEMTRVAHSEKATRRHSSPPLNANATEALSERASGDDGPGLYVVPQKRGGRGWSPVSSPRASERPTGFFPFRKTPSLLTPEAWRAGCLYIPEAPTDEASLAEAWLDSLSLNSVGCVSRDQGHGQPSWRDRYENDPASRRFYAVHRRAMTEG